jgi:hypothetical protein
MSSSYRTGVTLHSRETGLFQVYISLNTLHTGGGGGGGGGDDNDRAREDISKISGLILVPCIILFHRMGCVCVSCDELCIN